MTSIVEVKVVVLIDFETRVINLPLAITAAAVVLLALFVVLLIFFRNCSN